MGHHDMLLFCAALLPAVALCIYVFKKDRVEKEPIGLLMTLFFLGCAICFPAAKLEILLETLLNQLFEPYMVEVEGEFYLEGARFELYSICANFLTIALVEEGLKFAVLFSRTKDNKNFNCLFDGLIYSVFVSLGFAAFENVLYVWEYGWGTALLRAVTAVPGHMFFSVLMGHYYSLWHMYEAAKLRERELKEKGAIPAGAREFSGRKYLALAWTIPTFVHGLYDYCCASESVLSLLVLIAVIVFLYIYCFARIRKMSKEDTDDGTYCSAMILSKYPHLAVTAAADCERN